MAGNFMEDLKRAYEMEERMASVLIDLCEPAMTDSDSSDESVEKIRALLLSVHRDTLKHKEMVRRLLDRLSKEAANG